MILGGFVICKCSRIIRKRTFQLNLRTNVPLNSSMFYVLCINTDLYSSMLIVNKQNQIA